mmetsp:Transcript_16132/g.48634  ORF Transcript_16132/g.48634 Transcript_16132/m.48634 type:complete len:242 (-) Transcript_16132:358-1083(-)
MHRAPRPASLQRWPQWHIEHGGAARVQLPLLLRGLLIAVHIEGFAQLLVAARAEHLPAVLPRPRVAQEGKLVPGLLREHWLQHPPRGLGGARKVDDDDAVDAFAEDRAQCVREVLDCVKVRVEVGPHAEHVHDEQHPALLRGGPAGGFKGNHELLADASDRDVQAPGAHVDHRAFLHVPPKDPDVTARLAAHRLQEIAVAGPHLQCLDKHLHGLLHVDIVGLQHPIGGGKVCPLQFRPALS